MPRHPRKSGSPAARTVLRRCAAAAVCAAQALLAACGEDHAATPPAAPPPARVKVLTLQPDPTTSAEDAPGTVRARDAAVLSAKVSGVVTELDADPGRRVRRGDVVARIDDREIRARLRGAEAALAEATDTFRRHEKLLAGKVVTAQEFEAARSRFQSAQAAVDEARSQLEDCVLTAPFDGVMTRRFLQRGDLATPGRALAEIENPGALRLEALVPESLLGNVRLGGTLAVVLAPDRALIEGAVGEIAPASDPASRTTLVKVDLPPHPALRSGMFARLRIPTDAAPSLRVPAAAVIARGQLDVVHVVRGGRAQMRLVRTGRRESGKVEILAGLEPGEQVVVEGTERLSDGQPVAPD